MLEIHFARNSEESRFRAEVANFLRYNPCEGTDTSSLRAWQRKLLSARLFAVSYPIDFGGRGLPLFYESLLQEELVRYQCPQLPSVLGVSMLGPVLLKYGTEEQKSRFIPKMLDASEIWCQGFSETQAGSDLANLQCKARVNSDTFVVNGSKIWTSLAQIANYCFTLVRTGTGRYDLSFLLIPMQNVVVTPVRQLSGDAEFNQIFFDDISVPRENIVGDVNGGWRIAIATLMYERAILSSSRILQSENILSNLLTLFKAFRLELKEFKEEFQRCLAKAKQVRALSLVLAHESIDSVPGPEGSLVKLLWSEHFQEVCKLNLDIHKKLDFDTTSAIKQYLYSRGRTIAAGSSEIQRNIIAERIIGLGKSY